MQPKIALVSSAPYVNTQQLPTSIVDESQKYPECSSGSDSQVLLGPAELVLKFRSE